jgi:phosphatidylglycerol---prolipoprotein diacylglyceryl transferase
VRPILFRLHDSAVYSHWVFILLGTAVALLVSVREARRAGRWDQDLLVIIAGGLVGAALLARYGLVLRYLQDANEPTLRGFLSYGGKSLLGGLAGAYGGVVITKRLIGYRRRTGDLLLPGVALGMAIGRIGCFLAERPGTVTAMPWAVRVPRDAAARIANCPACAAGLPMHPSFLYESAFLALATWMAFRAVRRPALPAPWMREGDLFKLFLLAYATFRFFVELVRGNPVMAFGLSGSQLMVLPSALVLAAYFHVRRRGSRPAAAAVAVS